MTDRERSRLFIVAAVGAVAVLAVISTVFESSADRQEEQGTARPPRRTVLAPAAPRPRRGKGGQRRASAIPGYEDLPPGTSPPRLRVDPRAGRAAERFLTAFLRIETGSADREQRMILRASATADLARRVLATPARVPLGAARPEPGSVTGLDPVRAPGDRPQFVATIARDGRETGLVVEMSDRGSGWRVSGLR